MAYATPTASEFKTAMVVFSAVPDPTVEAAIADAESQTDSSWPDADRLRGVILLAAHNLTLDGQGSSNEAQFGAFKRLKIGSLELEKAESGTDTAARGSLGSTSYGTRFLAIVRRLFPPVLVV